MGKWTEEQLQEQEMQKFLKLQEYKSKLNVGDVFKNYKVLCEHLGEDPRVSQNSRNSHIKDLNEYFKFDKNGNKIIITEIADVSLFEREDGRNGNANIYGEQLELVIMNILLRCESSYMTETRDYFTQLLGMYNYALNAIKEENSAEKNEYATSRNIALQEVDEFIETTKQRTNKAFTRALERLEEKKLITYYDAIEAKVEKLSRKEEKTYYYDTFYKDDYFPVEREVLNKFKCKTEAQVYAISKVNPQFLINYRATLNRLLYEKLGIVSHYKAIEISFNREQMEDYIKIFFKDEELLSEIKKLNTLIVDSYLSTQKANSEKVVEFGLSTIIDESKPIYEDYEEAEVFLVGNKVKTGEPEIYFTNLEQMARDLIKLRDVDNRQRKANFKKLDEKYGFNYAN